MILPESNFDVHKIVDNASSLKYTKEIRKLISRELQSPSFNFVKLFASEVYSGRLTEKVMTEFTGLVEKAFNQTISDRVNDRLNAALNKEAEEQQEIINSEYENIFAKELTKNFDVYVNDAFSVSHRKHASIVRVTQFLPSIAGDSLLSEIKNLELFINTSRKPSTAIIGGSKISTKINIIHNLVKYFDNIISPGIPNIHPWNMGISPPMSPTKTRKIPSDIMNICLTIWMNVMRQVSYSFS